MNNPEKNEELKDFSECTIFHLWPSAPNAKIEKHKTSKDILNERKQEMRDFLNKKGKRR